MHAYESAPLHLGTHALPICVCKNAYHWWMDGCWERNYYYKYVHRNACQIDGCWESFYCYYKNMHVETHACKNAWWPDACNDAYYYQNISRCYLCTTLNSWCTHVKNSIRSKLGVHVSRYIDSTVLNTREGNYFFGAPTIKSTGYLHVWE